MNGVFPGNSSLFQQLDKQVLMVLRDGRHLVGYLRSFDQYSNIILEDTFERHVADGLFCDIELGLNIIRGDNIVLVGELDSDKERDQPHLKRVELEKVLQAEERLNEQGDASVRQQWDFEQQH
uniref:U6 snRNA-associated Sm-like protein LSm1 n=2 Tax=Peronosporaceae TaxID=4777 RepID=M4C101_HYAAE